MDWDAWARHAERGLDVTDDEPWQALFAPGATFSDPRTPLTTDLQEVVDHTRRLFPDWRQEVTGIRGDDRGASFEWIGRGTFQGRVAIEMRGCTVVDVDSAGLVTSWRDYLDTQGVIKQISDWQPVQEGE